MEFYAAAVTCLPDGIYISPDAAYFFGASGFIDFYINNNYHRAIELLREGSKPLQHEEFITGPYSPMQDIIKEKRIIDFRHASHPVPR